MVLVLPRAHKLLGITDYCSEAVVCVSFLSRKKEEKVPYSSENLWTDKFFFLSLSFGMPAG